MENYEVVLEHHGVKGMKWGVRRYQNRDGSLTPQGKRRLGIGESISGYFKKRKAESAKKKAAAAKQKEEDEKKKEVEDVEAKKAEILKSRSPKAIYENAHLFSNNELQTAYNRLQLERNIANLSPADTDAGKSFVDNFTEKTGKLTNAIDSSSKLYNNVAKVYNSFLGNKNGKALPLISDKVVSGIDKMKEETDRINAQTANKEAKRKASGWQSETDRINEETKNINAKVANAKAKENAYNYAKEFAEKYGSKTVDDSPSTGPIDVTPSSSTISQSVISSGKTETQRLLKSPDFTVVAWKNPED